MNDKVMHQVKIFEHFNSEVVTNEANKWFAEHPDICVFDVTHSKPRCGTHIIFVLYDPMEEDEDERA